MFVVARGIVAIRSDGVVFSRWFTIFMFLRAIDVSGIGEDNVSSTSTVLSTPYGVVIGDLRQSRDTRSLRLFRGIPYARPPVGDLRWAPPDTNIDKFTEDYDARHYRPRCPSARSLRMENVANSETRAISEDCLYLDVASLSSSKQELRPVVVYIHGQDLACGSNSQIADISTFASEDIVQVTVEHRREVLGFLTVEEVSLFGNYALLDVVAALRWVSSNIESFGGDAGHVMLFGTGASAKLVQALLISPLAKGTFHRAVVGGSNFCFGSDDSWCGLSTRGISATEYFDSLGCYSGDMSDRLACARLIDWNQIVDATYGRYEELQLDGDILPLQPREAFLLGAYNRMPVIVGYTRDASTSCGLADGTSYAHLGRESESVVDLLSRHACCGQDPVEGAADLLKLYVPFTDSGSVFASIAADMELGLSSWMLAQYLQVHSPVYVYVFSARLSHPKLSNLGMRHGHDFQFLLNSTCCSANLQYPMTDSEQKLGAMMRAAWASFLERGFPKSIGVPSPIDGDSWPSFNETGFATLYRHRLNQSTLVGTHHWYAIGSEGGISVPNFRASQFAFLANWRGLTGPPFSEVVDLTPGEENDEVVYNTGKKNAPWAMREILIFIGVVVGCLAGLMLQRFWNWRREVRAVSRPLLPEIERMLHEQQQLAMIDKEADEAACFVRASEARKLSEAKQVQRRRFVSARR